MRNFSGKTDKRRDQSVPLRGRGLLIGIRGYVREPLKNTVHDATDIASHTTILRGIRSFASTTQYLPSDLISTFRRSNLQLKLRLRLQLVGAGPIVVQY